MSLKKVKQKTYFWQEALLIIDRLGHRDHSTCEGLDRVLMLVRVGRIETGSSFLRFEKYEKQQPDLPHLPRNMLLA